MYRGLIVSRRRGAATGALKLGAGRAGSSCEAVLIDSAVWRRIEPRRSSAQAHDQFLGAVDRGNRPLIRARHLHHGIRRHQDFKLACRHELDVIARHRLAAAGRLDADSAAECTIEIHEQLSRISGLRVSRSEQHELVGFVASRALVDDTFPAEQNDFRSIAIDPLLPVARGDADRVAGVNRRLARRLAGSRFHNAAAVVGQRGSAGERLPASRRGCRPVLGTGGRPRRIRRGRERPEWTGRGRVCTAGSPIGAIGDWTCDESCPRNLRLELTGIRACVPHQISAIPQARKARHRQKLPVVLA